MSKLLFVHICFAISGMVLGFIAMTVRKRPKLHTRIGHLYHWTILVVAVLAIVLVIQSWPRLWWFLIIALLVYGLSPSQLPK